MYYLAMDGGGTKLVGLLFDEKLTLVASARAEGTHRSVYPEAEIHAHIKACYAELFSALPRPLCIETLYTVCGSTELYAALLPEGVTLARRHALHEAVAGLYAGSLEHSGFVALAGTGSDVFCVRDDRLTDMVGGFGAILGDEGSGVWMARRAMQLAIRAEQGWGEPTAFGDRVKTRYGLSSLWDYIAYLYASPAPFRRLGELLPLVAESAREGDMAMLEILREGGNLLGRQMLALLRRNPEPTPRITACGGAWKAHPAMAEAFIETVRVECPAVEFTFPQFEHIMAGPVCLAMEQGLPREEAAQILSTHFPTFVWNHG